MYSLIKYKPWLGCRESLWDGEVGSVPDTNGIAELWQAFETALIRSEAAIPDELERALELAAEDSMPSGLHGQLHLDEIERADWMEASRRAGDVEDDCDLEGCAVQCTRSHT